MSEYKYLRFEELTSWEGKTQKFIVRSKTSNGLLGTVKWYAPWRKYCFFTVLDDLVFDAGCLSDICDFMNMLMAERKEQR